MKMRKKRRLRNKDKLSRLGYSQSFQSSTQKPQKRQKPPMRPRKERVEAAPTLELLKGGTTFGTNVRTCEKIVMLSKCDLYFLYQFWGLFLPVMRCCDSMGQEIASFTEGLWVSFNWNSHRFSVASLTKDTHSPSLKAWAFAVCYHWHAQDFERESTHGPLQKMKNKGKTN